MTPTRAGPATWAWAAFQGGRDPYIILVTIYVFAPYLATAVIGDPVRGQAMIASGAKYGGWVVALTAPLLGAVVDRTGPRKPWLTGVVGLMAPLMVALWWVEPGGAGLGVSAAIAILAALAVMFAWTQTLHNALLVPAAGLRGAGAASGLGLALGNLVSVAAMLFVLWAFVLPGKAGGIVPPAPLFGLSVAAHEPDRAAPVVAALLLVLGTVPLLRLVPDLPATGVGIGRAVRLALGDLRALISEARGHRDVLVYLGSSLLFTDGLTGILIFTGVYSAGVMGWRTPELLLLGLILSTFSVAGGLLAGRLDGRIGPKRALAVEIVGVVVGQVLALGQTPRLLFYRVWDPAAHGSAWGAPVFRTAPELALVGCYALGAITVTAAYSSSRTMLTRVAPAEKVGVFFGLFVIAGSATVWLGPLLVQVATLATGSQRAGLLPLSGLLLAGLAVLGLVRGGGRLAEPAR